MAVALPVNVCDAPRGVRATYNPSTVMQGMETE
jgi:hypothetical protein